jgi:hypothetical protein
MDLTPALGKLYLARVNPLLGEIIGPGIGDEDLPDVTLYVAPENFVLPSDEYSFRIEPMKTVEPHSGKIYIAYYMNIITMSSKNEC